MNTRTTPIIVTVQVGDCTVEGIVSGDEDIAAIVSNNEVKSSQQMLISCLSAVVEYLSSLSNGDVEVVAEDNDGISSRV